MTTRRPLAPAAAPMAALIEPLQEDAPVRAAASGRTPGASARSAQLPGLGWAHDRHTLAAARRGFGELRRQCLRAADALPAPLRRDLVEPIQQASDLGVLGPLQQRLLRALQAAGPAAERPARELASAWHQAVCDSGELQPFGRHRDR